MSLAAACMIFTMFQGSVCLWQPGGAQPVALSPEGTAASYSPLQITADGSRVYYNADHNLWEANTRGAGKPRQLTRKGYAKVAPGEDYAEAHECDAAQLSPDGRLLAYRWSPADVPELWVLNLQTGEDRKLATNVENGPETWTLDSRTVLFSHDGSLWQVAPDGSGLTQVTHCTDAENAADGQASFSRTGVLTFVRGTNIWIKRPGQAEEQVTHGQSAQWPTWSPDGLRLSAVAHHVGVDDGREWDDILVVVPGQEPKVILSTRGKDAAQDSAADVIGWLSSNEILVLRTIGDAPPKLWGLSTESKQVRMIVKLRDGDEAPALWVAAQEGEG
jgi:Tol biopolymer transport system component